MSDILNIAGRIHSISDEGIVTTASEIKDEGVNKRQSTINAEVQSELGNQSAAIDALENQNYVNISATNADTTIEDVFTRLGITPSADTIYRVANWKYDATTKYNTSYFSEYSVNISGSTVTYVPLMVVNLGIDSVPVAGSENLVESGGVANAIINREIDMNNAPVGSLSIDGTVNGNSTNFNTTDYIPVKAGYKFAYKGYTGPSSTTAIACGYPNKSSSNAVVILAGAGSKTIETTIVVPEGVNYVRIAAANSGHASYNGRYLYRQDFNGIDEFGSGERLQDTGITSILRNDENLPRNSEVVDVLSFELPFDGGSYVLQQDGTAENVNTKFNVTDYIYVKPNSLIHYKGYLGTQYAAICGYDVNKQNPTVILSGSNSGTQDTFVNVPSSGVSYIRACGANDTHSSFNGRVLELCNTQSLKDFIDKETGVLDGKIAANTSSIASESLTINAKIDANAAKYGGETIIFNNVGQLRVDGTVRADLTNFNTSDFIPVNEGDLIQYKGHTGNTYYAPIVGYDVNKENATVLHVSQSNVPFEVVIPGGTAYIRVSAANSEHSSYDGRYCKIIARYYRYVTDDIASAVNDIEEQVDEIHDTLIRTVKSNISLTDSGAAIWAQFTTIGAHLYYINSSIAPTEIKLYSGYGASTTLIRTLSGTDISSLGNNLYSITITAADITGGANWMRITKNNLMVISEIYVVDTYEKLDEIETVLKGPLHGKKISVIGDSISTINGNNTPYFTIMGIDVGHEIQSYISYVDVYGTDTSENPTPLGTTIGGVTLTADMIGTLQTFTPVAGDVGKMLGQAYNYNNASTKVWSEVLCEKTGAVLLANASFSGASMCSGQSGIWTFSHAFSPMTIGRCRVRDEEGNYVNPDVIIIYRGTNDLSHNQGGTGYSRLDEYTFSPANNGNSYPETDTYDDNGTTVYGFRRAYYKTIQALRTAYPGAIIYCCTLNVFKRVYYSSFPTRNGRYTLPDMNDCIRDIANKMGCGVIEFDKDGITFENCYSEGYITDSSDHPTHPNSKGHEVMARKAIEDLRHTL